MLKQMIRALLTLCLVSAGMVVATSPARADYNYVPTAAANNGHKVFLSVACHDGNDGVPGGACIPNIGCKSHNENTGSLVASLHTASGTSVGFGSLVDRGYKVRVGNGTAGQNITSSNQFGADVHIPVHSNATNGYTCSTTVASNKGTLAMYASTAGKACADYLRSAVGPRSPGTNDIIQKRTNLGELNQTNATACYLEVEYHTWNKGVDFIKDVPDWTWRVAMAVEQTLGYP
ncbi:hypothetical protein ACTVCO_01310 [Sanguibacter sp. A247]|uniref:hypothetical protein n=1 Tax=unclassified Sanguibacter TaxID=2645534 RepID=UPI003FD8BD69